MHYCFSYSFASAIHNSSPMLIILLAERNLMVKRMIPHLKRMCMERDVVLSYVDLRWGVTAVQGEQAAAVLMCLRELDKSNLFVGSFGERYGKQTSI